MDKKNHKAFRSAQEALKTPFEEAYKGKLFLSNLGWAFAGLMMLFIAISFVGMVVLVAGYLAVSRRLVKAGRETSLI